MSTRPDADWPEHDARVDAAWRNASNESPPPALDDAILAAAHRAVGARPGRVDAPVPEATRPERWWFPLAAAATIGAITVGLLQLAATDPPDGIDPTKMIVSDVPPAAATDTRNDAAAASKATSAVPVTQAPPPATPERAPVAIAVPPPALTGAPAPAPATAARAQPKIARSGQGAPAAAEATGSTAGGGGIAAPAPPAPTAPTAAEQRDAAAPMPFPRGRTASTPDPATAPAPVAPASPAAAAVAPPPAPRAAMATNAPESVTLPGVAKRAAPSTERRDAREPLPVAEWIALIRKLRNEGRDAEAEQELVAFRKLHPDHEQLLPPDLSRWTPAAK